MSCNLLIRGTKEDPNVFQLTTRRGVGGIRAATRADDGFTGVVPPRMIVDVCVCEYLLALLRAFVSGGFFNFFLPPLVFGFFTLSCKCCDCEGPLFLTTYVSLFDGQFTFITARRSPRHFLCLNKLACPRLVRVLYIFLLVFVAVAESRPYSCLISCQTTSHTSSSRELR